MAIASLHLPQPIRRRHAIAPRDYGRRDRAIELYEAGRFLDSVQETLAYLLPGTPVPDLHTTAFVFVQGSARVRLTIEADDIVLRTVLAALGPDAQATAALRFFLTRLSSTGQMFQPRLRGDEIALEFRDRLALLHPLKLIEVLQRMPMEADSNDSWMVEQFGVQMADRDPIAPLEPEEFERALAIWNAHWSALDELMMESRRRRSVRFLDAVGCFAAYHLRYSLPLFGAIRARLNEGADDFTDRDENPNKRDTALAKCIKDMRRFSPDELRACLGHATYAINPLQEGTPSLLTSTLGSGNRMQTTGELRATGRSMEAALELISDYLDLLAHYSWSGEVEIALRAGLNLVSGRPWREAADALWNHANATARVFGSHGEHDRDDDDDDTDAGADDGVSRYDA